MIETALLNAVIANRDWSVLVRYGLADKNNFPDQTDAFKFIQKHLNEYGELPSVESVITKCPKFEYTDTIESVDTLCLRLIERNVKLSEANLLKDIAGDFSKMDAYKVLEKMRNGLDELQNKANMRSKSGVNWSVNGAERLEEYERRKQKDFTRKVPVFFDQFTDAVGGLERGEYITIEAFTGKGKSWLGLLQALVANHAGFRVLIESGEMSKEEVQFRLDTLEGKFSNRGLWTGQLGFAERTYKDYVGRFHSGNGRADLIVKTPDDWADGLHLGQLKSDIERTKCDVVIVDQFNLMRFKGNSKDDKAAQSRALKQIAAKLGVVLIVLYQTNGEFGKESSKGEDGIRELKLPDLGRHYSETIAVIQDSNKVFGFDAVTWRDPKTGRQRGKAVCGVLKSRTGGEGTEIEIDWQPNDGVIAARTGIDVF